MNEETLGGSIITQQCVSESKRILAYGMRHNLTPAEQTLWEELRGSKLGAHFRRQQVVDGFILDFYCHSSRLAVEVDGDVHNTAERSAYDAERDRILGYRGLRLLRFKNAEVMDDICGVVNAIKSAL